MTSPDRSNEPALVGVNYFAGWWEPQPNKWHEHEDSVSIEQGADWRPRYPERVPLLGCYNDQPTMDREIVAAAEHGVDFFAILWYPMPDGSEFEPNARFLNRGVDNFMASPQAHRMRFIVEYCNHPPFELATDDQWRDAVERWIPMFEHPGYLRVGERLVFKIHGANHFIGQRNGNLGRCREQLECLREAVRRAGLGEMIIGGGVIAGEEAGHESPITELFDFTCTYMDVPAVSRRDDDLPYAMLADLARGTRHNRMHDAVPHMPYLPAGWNPRPWPDDRATFAFPGRSQWRQELVRMREDLELMPNLGLPHADGGLTPAFTIYAWNEFGEGGIVAPTQGDGYMKLEEIRDVFGVAPLAGARRAASAEGRDA